MAKYLQLLGTLPSDGTSAEEIIKIVEDYLAKNPPKDGEDGEDGFSPVVTVDEIDGGHRITITDANGPHAIDVMNGKDGPPGAPGADGADGKDGADGQNGADGKDGASAYEIAVAKGFEGSESDWLESLKGADGAPGADGKDGHTPVKGTDYFTDDEIDKIAQKAAEKVELPEVTIDQVLPSQVVFPEGKQTTYAIGKVKLENGIAELIPKNGTLEDFFEKFIDEQNPSTTDPSVSLTFSQAKAYEVGTKVTPSYSASLNAGSYTYGPATGVTASAWAVSDTSGNSKTTASGSFPELTVSDGMSYKITAKATHGDGAVPVTNTGNAYASGQIKAGTKSATSGAVTGYRNTFYGTLTAKSDPTSAIIRGLTKSGKALSNGNSFTITVPVGALRVIFSYPETLRDVTSVKDVNGMNAEISSGFTKKIVAVEGANSYKAVNYKTYIMDFATANDKANKFTVTI